jgi:hypothetical protein
MFSASLAILCHRPKIKVALGVLPQVPSQVDLSSIYCRYAEIFRKLDSLERSARRCQERRTPTKVKPASIPELRRVFIYTVMYDKIRPRAGSPEARGWAGRMPW